MKDYIEFLKDKMAISHQTGFEVRPEEISPYLYPHVKDTVRWAISGGCRAIFSSFGMQKTVTQLEILRVILNRTRRQRVDSLPQACSSGVPDTGRKASGYESDLCTYYAGGEAMSDQYHGDKL